MMEENKNCPYLNTCNHIDCDRFCMKRFKTEYYFDNAFVPQDKRLRFPLRIDADGSDSEAFTRLSEIEKNIEDYISKGNNLYIYSSSVGCGKTSWSFRLIQAYINKTWFKKDLEPTVLFISVPKFLLQLKSNIENKSDYIEHINKYVYGCDLVVWDDIGSKAGTEFEVSHLLSIIDQRILNKKSNIYTSNLDSEDLHNFLGDRVYSRIYNYSECIKFVGKDKRNLK